MRKINLKHLPLPGLRNLKSSLAVFLCLLVYHLLGRDSFLLAAVASLICMQDSVEKSIHDGVNRVFGTIVGGFFGVIVGTLASNNIHYFVLLLVCAFGVSMLIYVGVLIHKRESITISCIVFLTVVGNTTLESPLSYSLNRVLDTTIGIAIAVLVNRFFFSPDHERSRRKKKREVKTELNYVLKRAYQQEVRTWDGGTSTEIYIFPQEALYGERNFKWRISSVTVNLEESIFTKMKGYMRHIMVLDGQMRLVHQGQHAVNLERFGHDFFDGSWDTKSFGKCTDFNVMLGEGFVGNVNTVTQNDKTALKYDATTAFYCVEDMVDMSVTCKGEVMLHEVLQKGDFISFCEIEKHQNEKLYGEYAVVFEKADADKDNVVAIKVDVTEIV